MAFCFEASLQRFLFCLILERSGATLFMFPMQLSKGLKLNTAMSFYSTDIRIAAYLKHITAITDHIVR